MFKSFIILLALPMVMGLAGPKHHPGVKTTEDPLTKSDGGGVFHTPGVLSSKADSVVAGSTTTALTITVHTTTAAPTTAAAKTTESPSEPSPTGVSFTDLDSGAFNSAIAGSTLTSVPQVTGQSTSTVLDSATFNSAVAGSTLTSIPKITGPSTLTATTTQTMTASNAVSPRPTLTGVTTEVCSFITVGEQHFCSVMSTDSTSTSTSVPAVTTPATAPGLLPFIPSSNTTFVVPTSTHHSVSAVPTRSPVNGTTHGPSSPTATPNPSAASTASKLRNLRIKILVPIYLLIVLLPSAYFGIRYCHRRRQKKESHQLIRIANFFSKLNEHGPSRPKKDQDATTQGVELDNIDLEAHWQAAENHKGTKQDAMDLVRDLGL